jgi:hypothetical protein
MAIKNEIFGLETLNENVYTIHILNGMGDLNVYIIKNHSAPSVNIIKFIC